MNQALLWCDTNAKTPLAEKVKQAVARHTAKFGIAPTVCYVNAAQLNGEREAAGVELKADTKGSNPVPKWHLWIGVE